MAGLGASLMPRTAAARASGAPWYSPRVGIASIMDQASLPGRAYASLGRMEDESYLDALGRTGPRYVVGQGEGDEMADAILRDPLTPVGLGLGSLLKGVRPVVGMASDLGSNAAGMAADQYATTGAVNGGEIGAGAGMGALLGLGGMAKGGKRSMISPEEREANLRNWFGDSKVVDADGKPLVVYHGTAGDFNEFSFDELGKTTGATSAKKGFFFSENPYDAASYILPDMIQKKGNLDIGGINPFIKSKDADELVSRYREIDGIEKAASARALEVLPKINRLSIQNTDPISFAQKIDDALPIKIGLRREPHEFGGENIFLGRIPVGRTSPRASGQGFVFDSFLDNYDKLRNGLSGFYIQEARPDLAKLMQVYLKAESPKILDSKIRKIRIGESATRRKGTDATNFLNVNDPIPSNYWIVYDPTQIKSATSNRGTFDPNDPNITHFAGPASTTSRNRATTRLERQAAQVAYDKYGRPREESAARPVSAFQGLGSLLSSPSDTYYTRGGR